MKPETRLEILEAFASSKPTEFDGFVIRYLEAHPELPEPTPEQVTADLIEDAAPMVVSKKKRGKAVEVIPDEQ